MTQAKKRDESVQFELVKPVSTDAHDHRKNCCQARQLVFKAISELGY